MSKELRYYKISAPDLRELLMAAFTYYALEAGGVDNWEWAGASIQDWISESSAIDFVHYENMEEIVESALSTYQICKCKQEKNMLDVAIECFGLEK